VSGAEAFGLAVSVLVVYGGEACSALYRPAYREELYELARAALFALGSGGADGSAPVRR
jgi:hypothetical protein